MDDIILSNGDRMQKRKFGFYLAIVGLLTLIISLGVSGVQNSQAQILYFTPTPDTDGRIFYTVRDGDTCISVSLLNQVSLDELRMLNNLDATCVLITGQLLLLGTAEPQPSDSGPAATETPLLPSPTPFQGNGQVCIILFNDINGNAMVDDNESALAGGAISLTDRIGEVSLTALTSNSISEPTCFDDLPEGDYNISVGVPDGYNPTTQMNYALELQAGDRSTLDFGAQLSSEAAVVPIAEGGRSPLLGILGGFVLLVGVALAVYARVLTRK
jgi:hypothetical protein